MRRSVANLLLVVFSAPFLGFYVYFVVRVAQITHEMTAAVRALPDDQLDLLIMPVSAYRRARVDEREIKVSGDLYDIVRYSVHDDTVILHVYHDAAEQGLLSWLETVIDRGTGDTKPVPTTIINLLTLQFTVPDCLKLPATATQTLAQTPYLAPSGRQALQLDTPPPRI